LFLIYDVIYLCIVTKFIIKDPAKANSRTQFLQTGVKTYTEGIINEARHTIDFKDTVLITLNIYLIQMGVSGNDS